MEVACKLGEVVDCAGPLVDGDGKGLEDEEDGDRGEGEEEDDGEDSELGGMGTFHGRALEGGQEVVRQKPTENPMDIKRHMYCGPNGVSRNDKSLFLRRRASDGYDPALVWLVVNIVVRPRLGCVSHRSIVALGA
jgi:hypothetical protein